MKKDQIVLFMLDRTAMLHEHTSGNIVSSTLLPHPFRQTLFEVLPVSVYGRLVSVMTEKLHQSWCRCCSFITLWFRERQNLTWLSEKKIDWMPDEIDSDDICRVLNEGLDHPSTNQRWNHHEDCESEPSICWRKKKRMSKICFFRWSDLITSPRNRQFVFIWIIQGKDSQGFDWCRLFISFNRMSRLRVRVPFRSRQVIETLFFSLRLNYLALML